MELIVVSTLSVCGLVETDALVFFGNPEAATDGFYKQENHDGDDGGVENRDDGSEGLDSELFSEGKFSAKKCRADHCCKQSPDKTSDPVDADDIKGVVVTDRIFQFYGGPPLSLIHI